MTCFEARARRGRISAAAFLFATFLLAAASSAKADPPMIGYLEEKFVHNGDGTYSHEVWWKLDDGEPLAVTMTTYDYDDVVLSWQYVTFYDDYYNPNPEDTESGGGGSKEEFGIALIESIKDGEITSDYVMVYLVDTPFGQHLLAGGKLLDVVWNPGDEEGIKIKQQKMVIEALKDHTEEITEADPVEGFSSHYDPDAGSIDEQIRKYLQNPEKTGFGGGGERFNHSGGPSILDLKKYGFDYMDMLGDPEVVYPPPEDVKR